jgi:hypothetical protein
MYPEVFHAIDLGTRKPGRNCHRYAGEGESSLSFKPEDGYRFITKLLKTSCLHATMTVNQDRVDGIDAAFDWLNDLAEQTRTGKCQKESH